MHKCGESFFHHLQRLRNEYIIARRALQATHAAPELLTQGRLTQAADVFAFGIIRGSPAPLAFCSLVQSV